MEEEDERMRFEEVLADVQKISLRMREALRRDFCAKLAAMSDAAREKLHDRIAASCKASPRAVDMLCGGVVSYGSLVDDAELAELVDSGVVVEPMLEVVGGMRRSFLSLQTAWELLKDWCDATPDAIRTCCKNEWELLSHVGTIGLPVEVIRRSATDPSPFAIEVTRVCPSPADTASFVTALRASNSIVPPEGGVAVGDLLVLVDPDVPRASRLALSSKLIKEEYTSVIYRRQLHMYTGFKMHIALHAHALYNVVQPPARSLRKEDLEAHMRRQYLGRAYQCASCTFGPIDHFACGDLAAHNGQRVGRAIINNACPRCGWFSKFLSEWPKWDGTVPSEALLSCARPDEEPLNMTAASADIALRICYSARMLWDTGEGGEPSMLCKKLADWETLTSADGVEHPVQLLLAMAVVGDLPDNIFAPVPMAQLLNEVCARRADEELGRIGAATARRRVGAFLGVSFFSAPQLKRDVPLDRQRDAVVETCRSDYVIDPDAFDFKSWVKCALTPWAHAILFVRRLRGALGRREGGWPKLARDMEAGPYAYADVISDLQRPMGSKDTPAALLGVRCKEEARRVLATVAAQAFLHASPPSRRTTENGGRLDEPLGDVREERTLRDLCVELRMSYYDEVLAVKLRQFDEARKNWEGAGHVHGLSKKEFWELWNASYGEDGHRFLVSANDGFVNRYGFPFQAAYHGPQ